MAEEFARNRQYEYRANSNLVLEADRDALIERARSVGIEHQLVTGTDVRHSIAAAALAERAQAHLSATAGVHPHHAKDVGDDWTRTLRGLLAHACVRAVGETGLDFYRDDCDPRTQKERFSRHIGAARQTKKPLIIHTRNAAKETLELMQAEQASKAGGVMHCFAEDWATAKGALDLGFYISFSGIVTFKNAQDLREVAQKVPLDRLLVETDAPYLAPVPFRGKRNEPAFVKHTAECLADLRGLELSELAALTTENFFRLFNRAEK